MPQLHHSSKLTTSAEYGSTAWKGTKHSTCLGCGQRQERRHIESRTSMIRDADCVGERGSFCCRRGRRTTNKTSTAVSHRTGRASGYWHHTYVSTNVLQHTRTGQSVSPVLLANNSGATCGSRPYDMYMPMNRQFKPSVCITHRVHHRKPRPPQTVGAFPHRNRYLPLLFV